MNKSNKRDAISGYLCTSIYIYNIRELIQESYSTRINNKLIGIILFLLIIIAHNKQNTMLHNVDNTIMYSRKSSVAHFRLTRERSLHHHNQQQH